MSKEGDSGRALSSALLDELMAEFNKGSRIPEYMMVPDESGELVSYKVDVKAAQRRWRLIQASRAALDRDSEARGIPRRAW